MCVSITDIYICSCACSWKPGQHRNRPRRFIYTDSRRGASKPNIAPHLSCTEVVIVFVVSVVLFSLFKKKKTCQFERFSSEMFSFGKVNFMHVKTRDKVRWATFPWRTAKSIRERVTTVFWLTALGFPFGGTRPKGKKRRREFRDKNPLYKRRRLISFFLPDAWPNKLAIINLASRNTWPIYFRRRLSPLEEEESESISR